MPTAAVLVATVLFAFVSSPGGTAAAATPRATAGHLDLSQWDFDKSPVFLDGEWEFYWNQLLDSQDFAKGTGSQGEGEGTALLYSRLPALWRGMPTPFGSLPGRGVATYRLLVTLPDPVPRRLGVSMPGAWSAYRLFVDGTLIAARGVVAQDGAQILPEHMPAVVPLVSDPAHGPNGRTVELILHVANRDFRSGGLLKSMALGRVDHLLRAQRLRHMLQVALMAAMIMMAGYHAVFYVWHRTRTTTLYFAIFVAVLAVRTGVTGELPLLTLFPGVPWEAHLRIEYAAGYFALLFFTLFLQALYPDDVNTTVVRGARAVGAVGGIAAIMLPVRYTSPLIPPSTVFVGLVVLYSLGVIITAFRRQRDGSAFFLVGGFVFVVCVVLSLLHYNQLGVTFDWIPVGTGVLLICQSLTVARRYALAFERETALSAQNAQLLHASRRLHQERQELQQLLGRQEKKLRRDIAEMLHGRTQARLHAAWFHIGQARQVLHTDPAKAHRLMDSAQDLIDQVREKDIREASHRLHPAALGVGLVPAIQSLLRPLQDRFQVHFHVAPALDELDEAGRHPLLDDVRMGVYRIAEEALNNIRRHAHARTVSVSLRCLPEPPPQLTNAAFIPASGEPGPAGAHSWLELIVADDGVGVDASAVHHGLGLRLIAARVAELGGRWSIAKRGEGGTQLYVAVPLHEALPHSKGTGPA